MNPFGCMTTRETLEGAEADFQVERSIPCHQKNKRCESLVQRTLRKPPKCITLIDFYPIEEKPFQIDFRVLNNP